MEILSKLRNEIHLTKEDYNMGWNTGYTIMEHTVVTLYDSGMLTSDLLDKIMEPYKRTDCDSGGSHDLKAKDGLGAEEIICKTMKPEEYKEVVENPKWYEGEEPETECHDKWSSNEKAYDLFFSIWSNMWGIW